MDLFGGSGLLSHITKREKPDVTVIYNDFDGYCKRLEHIDHTNQILTELRKITINVPRNKILPNTVKKTCFSFIGTERKRWIFCGLHHTFVIPVVLNEV